MLVAVPCGHAGLCAECADDAHPGGRGKGVCVRCDGEVTRLRNPVDSLTCNVCFDEVHASYLAAVGTCGHTLCASCAVGYARSALGDVQQHVKKEGIRCPLNYSGCESYVTIDVLEKLVARKLRQGTDVVPMDAGEFDRLARFIDEAHIALHERFYCTHPTCGRMFSVPHRDLMKRHAAGGAAVAGVRGLLTRARVGAISLSQRGLAGRRVAWGSNRGTRRAVVRDEDEPDVELAAVQPPPAPVDDDPSVEQLKKQLGSSPPFATCPFCERASCVRCNVPAHRLVTCAEVAAGTAGDTLTVQFVRATSKGCPRCGFRITHAHGHACHHIKPGTGCPNCGHHFCFACLKPGTSGSVCGCRLFCSNDGLLDRIALQPRATGAGPRRRVLAPRRRRGIWLRRPRWLRASPRPRDAAAGTRTTRSAAARSATCARRGGPASSATAAASSASASYRRGPRM